MTPAKLRWGLLFILVGVLLILNNIGKLDWDFWYELLIWWPLLLIAIGIEKIFQNTRLSFISYLSPLMLVVVIAFVAIDSGSNKTVHGFFSSSEWSEDYDPDVKLIEAVIEHKDADLYVGRSRHNLISAQFDRFTSKPDIEFIIEGSLAEFNVSGRKSGLGSNVVIRHNRRRQDWDFTFSDDTPLRLSCIGRRSDVDLYLESLPLEKLVIENDRGDIFVKVGENNSPVDISIAGYDADFRMKVPTGCGVKVAGDFYSGYFEKKEYLKIDSGYCTPNFDSASVQFILDVDEDLRHLSIEYY